MIVGVHHIGIAAADRAASAAFLAAAGFAQKPPLEAPTTLLAGPNCYVELIDAALPAVYRAVNEPGITHCCLQQRALEPLLARWEQLGGAPHATPLTLGTGLRYCYVRDAELRVFELEELPYAPPEQMPWVGHVGIASAQIERLASFYHEATGGERRGGGVVGPNPLLDRLAALAGVTAIPAWIVGGNISVEIWQYLTPPTVENRRATSGAPGYDHICFEVDDVPSELARLIQLGASAVHSPARHAAGVIALLRDPDGNPIELLAPASGAPSIAQLADPGVLSRMDARRVGSPSESDKPPPSEFG